MFLIALKTAITFLGDSSVGVISRVSWILVQTYISQVDGDNLQVNSSAFYLLMNTYSWSEVH